MYLNPVDRSSTLISTTSLQPPSKNIRAIRNNRQQTTDTEESHDNFFQFANIQNSSPNNSLPSPPQAIYRTASNASNVPMLYAEDSDTKSNINDAASLSSIRYNENELYTVTSRVPTINNGQAGSKDNDEGYKRASTIFLITSIISAILILVFESYMYAVINIHKQKFNSQERYAEISIYLSLFIFAAFYQILLTIIGLKTKNMLLLSMLCGFYACMLVYTGIQFEEIGQTISHALTPNWRRPTRGLNIATIAVIAVTLLVQVYMIFFVLRKNVKWFRYKKIGGDLRIKRMYTTFQIHRALLIFDFFFFVGFTVQFIVIMIAKKNSVEFILTVCVLPLTLLVLFASDFATTREIKSITISTIILFLASCAYVVFKVVRLYTKYSSAYNIGVTPGAYFPGRKSLVTFGIITLVLLVTTVAVEVLMLRNYRRGLLPMVSTYYKWLPYHNNNQLIEEYYAHQNISMATMSEKNASTSNNLGFGMKSASNVKLTISTSDVNVDKSSAQDEIITKPEQYYQGQQQTKPQPQNHHLQDQNQQQQQQLHYQHQDHQHHSSHPHDDKESDDESLLID